jgi:hypothetical protein
MPRGLLATLWVLTMASVAVGSEPKVTAAVPAKAGNRIAVIEFSSGSDAKPTDLKVVSTESLPLSEMAQSLLVSGKIGFNSPGVTKLADDRYRLTASFPVPNDGEPLPTDVTPPVPRLRPCPVYPYKLAESNVTGGVVLRLSIDEKARLQKVELVSASHPEFGPVAIQAVEKWLFAKPAMKDGKPAAVSMLQLLTFEFDGGKQAPLPWQITPEPHLPEYIVTTNPRTKPASAAPANSEMESGRGN